ncbi:hypothetical protein T01_15768 [Trichinella spiralis]|uniref:Uncharacterized protein n=1 Tax=Trichinella spiralis TaxID=6334 RepID=A0A0V1APQ8_TRISP|nr:hypothetical protein T01_3454 [Trichinella spiralis]KRY26679.1 hypothetical protein T01_15768 [Trichinella spiralis]
MLKTPSAATETAEITSFLPVPQADTGVSLLEAGTAGSTLALFQYFRQEKPCCWLLMTDRIYDEKQLRVVRYTGGSGRRMLEQFLEALMYQAPEPI